MSEPAVRPGTGGGMANHDPNQAKRVELILQQVDSLPTLSAVAVRLLELTTADDTSAKEVIELVASDPALSSKVIKLCRCHPRGRTSMVSSVDRAVVLLGFDALRSAVLSVQVFELFDQMHSPGGEVPAQEPVFDREMFWHHSLGVAVASERIVEASQVQGKFERKAALKVISKEIRSELVSEYRDAPRSLSTLAEVEAGVVEYIELMVSEWYNAEERERFMRGLAHLDDHTESATGVRFGYAGEVRQTAILKGMEAEGRALMEADPDAPESFFHQARGLVLHGYYTSEIGMKEELLFVGLPGRYDGYAPLSQISRAGGASNE